MNVISDFRLRLEKGSGPGAFSILKAPGKDVKTSRKDLKGNLSGKSVKVQKKTYKAATVIKKQEKAVTKKTGKK